jgi:hypothetical protein
MTDPTPDELSQMRGCLASPAWRLLVGNFETERANTTNRVMRIDIDPDESLTLRARQAGRDEVLGWFAEMLETAGWATSEDDEN